MAKDKSFCDLTRNTRTVLTFWKQRYLTLRDKRSLICSKLVYNASVKLSSNYAVDATQALHKDFLRNSKKQKIKHTTLIPDYTQGCLKDIDMNCKLISLKFFSIVR